MPLGDIFADKKTVVVKDGAKDGAKDGVKDGAKDGVKDGVKDGAKEVLYLIKQTPHITTKDLANQLNMPFRTVQRYLEKLKREKKITRIDGRKYGYWKIAATSV